MPIAAGKLNKWLLLQAPRDDSDKRDGMGQPEDGWPTIAEMWGAVEPLGNAESFSANQTRSTLTHRVTIRWRDRIDSTMRFAYRDRAGKTRYLQIDGTPVDPEERGEFLECDCQEQET